jgi:hypothetical protein
VPSTQAEYLLKQSGSSVPKLYHVHKKETAIVFFVRGLVNCMCWIIRVSKLSVHPPSYYPYNQEYTVVMYHSHFAMYTFTLYCLGIGDLTFWHQSFTFKF